VSVHGTVADQIQALLDMEVKGARVLRDPESMALAVGIEFPGWTIRAVGGHLVVVKR
jgi:hypothetical protein